MWLLIEMSDLVSITRATYEIVVSKITRRQTLFLPTWVAGSQQKVGGFDLMWILGLSMVRSRQLIRVSTCVAGLEGSDGEVGCGTTPWHGNKTVACYGVCEANTGKQHARTRSNSCTQDEWWHSNHISVGLVSFESQTAATVFQASLVNWRKILTSNGSYKLDYMIS